jgi:hypothetical protein
MTHSSHPGEQAPSNERPLVRHPEDFTPEQIEQLKRSRVVDAETYMRWLETGEGPDPWGDSSG